MWDFEGGGVKKKRGGGGKKAFVYKLPWRKFSESWQCTVIVIWNQTMTIFWLVVMVLLLKVSIEKW